MSAANVVGDAPDSSVSSLIVPDVTTAVPTSAAVPPGREPWTIDEAAAAGRVKP